MFVLYLILSLISVFLITGIIEYYSHQKRIYSIPIRIHINGTRGKSSVTRLVGAGLSAAGIPVITKVTGTYPRLILEDGNEIYIYRKAGANIIEQLNIVKYAVQRKVKAIVIECMALEPQYQWITENKMIHATIGVITNVRPDHTDVMGNTLPEIADALGKTIPEGKNFFTGENDNPNLLTEIAKKKGAEYYVANPNDVKPEEMTEFKYIEHRENVALALDICTHLGIERNVALKGMYKANPDPGALKMFKVKSFGKTLTLYNAFAANDPQSSLMIWNKLRDEGRFKGTTILLLNIRHDRLDRAKQLTEMISLELNNQFDHLILMGESTEVVENLATGFGTDVKKIMNLGWKETSEIFENILTLTVKEATIIGIGNMGGLGAKLAQYFEHRSEGTEYD
ncbi:capsule biosynthesis protein CapB [bacterium BMS3Abin03]|nr:capsule biosynthesis protein CapB [bacterium BMS3Abin03]